MAEDLMTYLDGKGAEGFEARPFYSTDGDFLTFYFRDGDSYARRIDDLLTVYLSMEGDELVGCKIKGVRRILETLDRFGVEVDVGEVKMSFLFLSGALLSGASSQGGSSRKWYEEMSNRAKNVNINRSDLVFSAN